MAFYRRRIPYSLGGDKLETSDVKVKRKLDSTNEQKLNEDITRLYESILPTVEDDDRRAKFVAKLERILNDRWPGNEIKVHVFGSSGNLLATKDSDGRGVMRQSRKDNADDSSGHMHYHAYEGPRENVPSC